MKTLINNNASLASDFAKNAHRNHFYIPEGTSYYHQHLCKVANLVNSATGSSKATAIAYLHDCMEDVGVEFEQLKAIFGYDVSLGVSALTKNKSLSKPLQIEDSVNRIKLLNPRLRRIVASVKLADRIANLENDPPWSQGKREYYAHESYYLLETLGTYSKSLSASLTQSIANFSNVTIKSPKVIAA